MPAQQNRVVRVESSARSTRGQRDNNVVQWRNQAGAQAGAILNAENNMDPEIVYPRRQFALGSALIAIAGLVYAAHRLGLV